MKYSHIPFKSSFPSIFFSSLQYHMLSKFSANNNMQSYITFHLTCISFSHPFIMRFKCPLKLFFCHVWKIFRFFFGYYHMIKFWSQWPQNLWNYRSWYQHFSTCLNLIHQFRNPSEEIIHAFSFFHLKQLIHSFMSY